MYRTRAVGQDEPLLEGPILVEQPPVRLDARVDGLPGLISEREVEVLRLIGVGGAEVRVEVDLEVGDRGVGRAVGLGRDRVRGLE